MTMTMCNAPLAKQVEDSMNITELVRGNERSLLERMEPLARRQSFALDLSAVERIDAAGVAALVALYIAAREAGHCFTVSHASPRVAEVLALLGLDRILLRRDWVQNQFSGSTLLRPAA